MTIETKDSPFLTVNEWKWGGNTFSVYVHNEGGTSHACLRGCGRGGSIWAHLPPELKIEDCLPGDKNVLWSTEDEKVRLSFNQFQVSGAGVHASMWITDIWEQLKAEFFPALTEAIALAAELRRGAAS
jgi:hypothetical protein